MTGRSFPYGPLVDFGIDLNRPLRILQIVSSTHTSGAERHAVALILGLEARGHSVDVVCPSGSYIARELANSTARVHEIDLKRGLGLAAQRQVRKLVLERRHDVIHAHLSRATYIALTASLFTGIPLVVSVHVYTKEPIFRFVAHRPNRIVAVSNYIRGVLNARGISDRYIDVVYNGTNFADVIYDEPMEVRREFEIPSDRTLVGLVGKVVREKGHMLALEALTELLADEPKTHLLFVGKTNGEFTDELERRSEGLGVRRHVTFTGERSDLPRLIDSMSFSILPSKMESFGLAVIESMARGKPVVASRVGGLCEVIQDYETGLLVDLTPKALGHGMRYMLGNDGERVRMGNNARKVIQAKFSTPLMVERIEQSYYRALGEA